MSDLIASYFTRDMTDDEDQALSLMLQESEEAAIRFGSLAQEKYLGYGFPAPKIPKGKITNYILIQKWVISIFVLAALGYFAWLRLCREPVSSTVDRHNAVIEKDNGSYIKKSDNIKIMKSEKTVVARVINDTPVHDITENINESMQDSNEARNIGKPPVLTNGTGDKYPELQVIIRLKNPGMVKVRVLDADGKQVRRLYEGTIQAGRWSFEWDGLMSNGEPASPGLYRIEVNSGGVTQSKSVSVH